jgi:hypothetical protein
MKSLHDLRLRLVIEIHERVSAEQQVHARNRRIVEQIVPPEYYAPAQVLFEDPAGESAPQKKSRLPKSRRRKNPSAS